MNKVDLEKRTKAFALRVIRFASALQRTRVSDVIGQQLLRSGTSIGANYREANRAESRKDFLHKIGIVEREAAETQYWLELCYDAAVGSGSDCEALLKESGELLAIFTSVGRKMKEKKMRNSKSEIRNSKSEMSS